MSMPVKHLVGTGTFFVSGRKPLMLQAYLGTCVGLALYCRETGVGGMIHLLLPEPSSYSAVQPEKYASTGIPIFIRALLDAGARRESLKAYLAGGALVGPVSEQDLALDIGGRTVEQARKVLASEKIDVTCAETGGFFTCCMNLNLADGSCHVEPVRLHPFSSSTDIHVPDKTEIYRTMERLKPIPQVALKVLRLMGEPDFDVHEISAEVRKDQVISARILQLANSAFFSSRQNIDSLDHSLIFLGRAMLVKLVLCAAVQSYFNQIEQGYSLCKGGLYYHAISCAQLSELLARKTKIVSPDIAYTAGLLHDIGKVVLDQYVYRNYPLFYRKSMEAGESFLALEARHFGIDHAEVGGMLAREWLFPESLEQAISHHHHPEKAVDHWALAVIVYLADLFLSRFHVGLEIERMDTLRLQDQFKALNLTSRDLAALIDAAPVSVFQQSADLTF